jgi:hypothetical protein
VVPSFKRLGAGFKALYNNNNKKLGIALFYAKDDEKSILMPTTGDFQHIKPMENTAFSIEGGLKLAKQLSWEGELATSILTENTMSTDAPIVKANPLLKLFKSENSTTKMFNALKSNLNYIIGQEGMIGVGYERVAPEYRTLGAYYFTNDFENITVNAQHTGKVNMGLSTGIQYDNLNDKKGSNSGRMVISSNVSFKANEQLNLTGNYSNFQSFTFIRTGFERINRVTPFDNLDTLNFTLLTQNAMINANYNFKQDSAKAQTLNMSLNFMESDSKRGSLTVNTPQLNNGSRFINSAMNYSIAYPAQKMTIVTGLNLSYNYGGISNTLTAGPMVMVSKPMFNKKIQANGMLAYNVSQTSQINQHVITLNMGSNTTVHKKHNLTGNILMQHRMTNRSAPALVFTGSVGYNYAFGYKFKKIPFRKNDLKENIENK